MSMHYGWLARKPEAGKIQIHVNIHGGNIEWLYKPGHNTPTEPYVSPDTEDWDRLLYEAERRLPRRLISQKQFDEIKRIRDKYC